MAKSLGILVFGFTVFLLTSARAGAINGADSNVFPDTSYPAGSTTYAVVQLRSGGAQVRARSTVANVYVPTSMAGQTIDLAIVNGCNNSGPDINGWVANTSFYIEDPFIAASERNTATHCDGGNINMQFTAVTNRSDGSGIRTVNEGGGAYLVYGFRADAYGSEATQYLNAFQVWAVNAGVYLGPSDTPRDCAVWAYPQSCPSPRPSDGRSLIYSSYYNRTSPSYGQRIKVRTGNCSASGKISLYDLDANDTGLAQNLTMEIRANGGTINTLNHAQISAWELYQAPDGSLPHVGRFGGNEDQYMDLPTVGQFSMSANTDYELIITGVSPNNAIQAAILTYVDSSCGEIPRPGCMIVGANNYDSTANVNDGSCDFCANISGNQPAIPDGFVKQGQNCVFPEPSCIAGNAVTAYVNEPLTLSARLHNNASVGFGGISAAYDAGNGKSGTVYSGRSVGASPQEIPASVAIQNSTPISGTATWTFSYTIPEPLNTSANVTCTQDYRITYRPPTCSVVGIVDPEKPEVGQRFRVRVQVTNPNDGVINLTSATYKLDGVTSGTNLDGNAQGGQLPQSMSAFGTTTLDSAQNITVTATTLNINVTWTVTADSGSVTCQLPNDATTRPDIVLMPPLCTITTRTAVVGVPFIASIAVNNPNRFAPLELIDSGYEYRVDDGQQGHAEPIDGWTNGKFSIVANGQIAVETDPPGITLWDAGDHSVSWSINSEAGYAGGDCDLRAANGQNPLPPETDEDGDGDPDTPIAFSLYTQPYARYYGNDVFAGGEYGDNCDVAGDSSARGYGAFSGNQNHATYRGAAAELAVFALGDIDGVLPGSQDITRSALNSLSFANTVLSGGTIFGGGFASPLCADDYWGMKPSSANLLPVEGKDLTGLDFVNIHTLANGTYTFSNDLAITTTKSGEADKDERLPAGTNITIYVDGNLWIGDSGFTAGRLRQIAYDTAEWTDIDQIPIVRFIARGNIYIDNEVSQLDGLYVAVPNPTVPDSGVIHTCAQADERLRFFDVVIDVPKVTTKCGRPLLVNGAFIAKRVQLLRIAGNVGYGAPAPEPYTSEAIAEVFRFSPELYLALLAHGTSGAASATFDAIVTMPPAL